MSLNYWRKTGTKDSQKEEGPLDPYLIERVSNMQLRTQLIVQSFLSGRHSSTSKLGSAEFSDYLEYTPGDEIRRIDWNVYAKTDRLYVRRFHDERALRSYFLLDLSASMDYAGPPETLKKYRYAVYIAAASASILVSQQDLVGLAWGTSVAAPSVASRNPRISSLGFLPPKGGKSHFHQLLHTLGELQAVAPLQLPDLLNEAAAVVLPRSLIFIMSDFIGLNDDVLKVLSGLCAGGSRVVALQVVDPWEYDFPFAGLTEFVHPETHEKMTLVAEDVRAEYLANFKSFQSKLKDELLSRGVVHHRCLTSDPFEQTMIELFGKIAAC